MKTSARLFAALIALALFSPAVPAAEVTLFAAASLVDVMKEAAGSYEKQSGDTVRFNFGASSILARQIEAGAPADVFFSADEARMDALEAKGLILKETRKNRLSNALAIVVATDSPAKVMSPADLASPSMKRVALADPKAVPAGIYSKTYLEEKKLWAAVEPKVIPAENVRAALAAVESGDVDAAMVYRTDAAISKKVKIACEIAPADGPRISYPVAVVKDSKQVEAAKGFVQYLCSDEAAKVFEKHGFVVLR